MPGRKSARKRKLEHRDSVKIVPLHVRWVLPAHPCSSSRG